MRSGPTNPELKELILDLEKGSGIWKQIAGELERPSRMRREVNLSRINRYAKPDEIILVPGKVLSSGNLDKSLTIAAWRFSSGAIAKIKKANGQAISLGEAMKKYSTSKTIRILG